MANWLSLPLKTQQTESQDETKGIHTAKHTRSDLQTLFDSSEITEADLLETFRNRYLKTQGMSHSNTNVYRNNQRLDGVR